MALKGTLKDFGIADILQLIGQQQKTGVLYIKSKTEEVEVSFLDGQVVRALSKTRQSRELLGTMLVNSGVLTEEQLREALEIQKRTLKRLGDILVAEGRVSADHLLEMTQLQTTETVYKLFTWHNGTYEFVQQDVEHDPGQGSAIRPESILMEGFRRIDEWPMVRRRIPSMGITFERAKFLDPEGGSSAGGDEVSAALDSALSTDDSFGNAPRSIGRNERLLYKLAEPELTAERLCEISRIGEFESCKALYNLVEAGYLKPVTPKKGVGPAPAESGKPRTREFAATLAQSLRGQSTQAWLGLAIVLVFALTAKAVGTAPETNVSVTAADASGTRRLFVDSQEARIMSALEVFRLSNGKYPDNLNELVLAHILQGDDLRYPFASDYYYKLTKGTDVDTYVLLPPLH